jgi:hypothetical protein
MRAMQTLKKLPHIAPSTAAATIAAGDEADDESRVEYSLARESTRAQC